MGKVCGDEREKGEEAWQRGEADEIKTPEVSTKKVSSRESPQLSGQAEDDAQREALVAELTLSSINRFRHKRKNNAVNESFCPEIHVIYSSVGVLFIGSACLIGCSSSVSGNEPSSGRTE